MKQHSFDQAEVLMLSRRTGRESKQDKWDLFIDAATELGIKVRVTGGNFLTHEVNADEEDFNVLLEITEGL